VQVGANAQSTVNFNTTQADAEVMRTLATNIPDAMVALGQAGATVIRDAGGSIVDLNKDSIAANSKAWDATLQAGVSIVDKAIDSMAAGYGLADKAIEKFQPTDNANADIGKYAMTRNDRNHQRSVGRERDENFHDQRGVPGDSGSAVSV
jgi:hypothetical protein